MPDPESSETQVPQAPPAPQRGPAEPAGEPPAPDVDPGPHDDPDLAGDAGVEPAGPASPVFVDHSGRRRRVLTAVLAALGTLAAGYLLLVVLSVFGVPVPPIADLPPGPGQDEVDRTTGPGTPGRTGTATEPSSPGATPTGGSAVPGQTGATTVPASPPGTAVPTTVPPPPAVPPPLTTPTATTAASTAATATAAGSSQASSPSSTEQQPPATSQRAG